MSEENQKQKFYKRIIELANWNVSISKKGKHLYWNGTMNEETTNEIIEFLFQKHGKLEEYMRPPTFIVSPRPITVNEPEKINSSGGIKISWKRKRRIERMVLIKIFKVLMKNRLGIIFHLALPKKREDGTEYWEMMDENNFIEIMERFEVFKHFTINIKQKEDS
jgi:hypothetical protein